MRINNLRVLSALLVLATGSFLSIALGQTSSARPQAVKPDVRHTVQLTAEDRLRIENAVVAHPQVQNIVGREKSRVLVSDAHVDKAEATAFLAGTRQAPPSHIVNVVVFNPNTNKAVHTRIGLEQNNVLEVREIKPNEVPLTREDANEALTLAKSNAEIQRALGSNANRFVVESDSDAREPYAAEVLPTASSDPGDPCSRDRCLELVFRNENGYFSFRAGVNLTKKTVTLISNQRRGGGHQ